MSNSDRLMYECFFADADAPEEDDGLIWKDVLREGEWAYRPGPNQKPIQLPLRVVSGYAQDKQEIGMQDLIDAFDDGAIEHVTIPTTHADKPHENTGFNRKLKIVERDGKKILRAGMEFTEPDIKEKVMRGSIANSSAGIIFDYVHKQNGKKYKQVLGHVALTNKPWITGNQPFGVAASENFSEDEIVPVVENKDQDQSTITTSNSYIWPNSTTTTNTGVVFDQAIINRDIKRLTEDLEAFGHNQVPDAVKRHMVGRAESLGATYLIPKEWLSENGANSGAEITSHTNKEENMADSTNETETPVNPPSSAPEVTQETLDALRNELSEQFKASLEAKDEQIAELRASNSKQGEEIREARVDKRVAELSKAGFSEYPGLLAEIRKIMLADEGTEVLSLSESPSEGTDPIEVNLSATDIVERVISALPHKDGKLSLSDQATELEDHSRPPSTPETEEFSDDPEEVAKRVDKFAEEVGYVPAMRGEE